MGKSSESSFDPMTFLATVNPGRSVCHYDRDAVIYDQGSVCDSVYHLRQGRIKIRVASKQGKEGIIAILDPGAFFGEGCLLGQPKRSASAVAMVASEVLRVGKGEMLRVLREEPSFGEVFIRHLLVRNRRVEADLVDQLFNSSEKRLARTLLLLAGFSNEGGPQPITTRVNQEMLAEMIGTTRPRVSFFMNKFKKLGFISYDGQLKVHSRLLTAVLNDGESHG